ncbi:MAG TPA: hypothetical protein VN026_09240 [Bacteroidia bacterium]|jgi:hypothetical protein|nr:hypothetical protein [Bacteroidia bacterium]
MFQKIKHLLLILALIAGVYACVKKKTFSQKPEITYKSFTPFVGDSADMVIGFSDGDGNIGAAIGDTTKNLFMNYYYKDTISQKFVAFYDAFGNDSLKTGYTIRKPSDSYEGKSISGEVAVRISKYRHSKRIKTIKYVIYMFDEKGNKSNVLTTPELTVP